MPSDPEDEDPFNFTSPQQVSSEMPGAESPAEDEPLSTDPANWPSVLTVRIRTQLVSRGPETWTRDNMPDSAIQLQTHSVYCRDHTEASGKNKGGGVCVYINNKWCSDVQVVEKHCSVDTEVLMVKCRPFYLQREFSAVFVLAVYILPRANQTAVLRLLHDTISKQKTTHPDAVFVVAGDFNHFILRTVLPKYHQHVSYPTRDNKILDQVYSNVKGTYKAAPCPHLSQSDHISMFLYPSYRQLLKQAPPSK
ncbi:uncharacterized protein AB9X84_007718 isoform 1-T1 [Acanthopagrus schlegelii]